MTTRTSNATRNGCLSSVGIDEQFNLSFLFIYSGTEPATADEPLDMVAVHTELTKVSNNSTATGLTFGTAALGVLAKTIAEVWSGVVTLDGFDEVTDPATPTFYRLCAAGDNGRGAANASTGYRIQGSVGGPGSGADLVLGTATLASTDTQPIAEFEVRAE
ncbi:MAG: hypothetical protein ACREO0_04650 [Pseudoxanthomonas sp.]